MNYKTIFRIMALALAMVATLSFASCSKNKDKGGDMTDQSSVSKDENNQTPGNTNNNSGDATFTKDYYNWLYSESYRGFYSALEKTTLPEDFAKELEAVDEKKRPSVLKNIFFPNEVIAAVQSVYEYENKATTYTHDVVSVNRNTKGIYMLTMKFTAAGTTTEKMFELHLNDGNRAVKLTTYDGDANVLATCEIVLTNDNKIAVNRATAKADAWPTLQLMFKADGSEAADLFVDQKRTEAPQSIYPNYIYAGFAGKN
jgi:hypothetical protein